MGCRGLQHYMSYILPSTEWANDAMRPALVTILRRLDKVFQKISKKPSIRVSTDNNPIIIVDESCSLLFQILFAN